MTVINTEKIQMTTRELILEFAEMNTQLIKQVSQQYINDIDSSILHELRENARLLIDLVNQR